MVTIKRPIILLLSFLCAHFLQAQTKHTICGDSSFHFRYYSTTDSFTIYKQIQAKDGGRIIIGKCLGNPFHPAALIAKFDNKQQVEWCKKIIPNGNLINLHIYAVEEALNGNIAISGIINENASIDHFYYALLSSAGTILKQGMPQFTAPGGNMKGVHTISRLPGDSLLFLFYSNGY